MKALAVSSNAALLDDVRSLLDGVDAIGSVRTVHGSLASRTIGRFDAGTDLLLLDCSTDAGTELDALERLVPMHPGLNTVLLLRDESPEVLLRALRMGVREVVKPPLSRDAVLEALRRIQAGAAAASGPRRLAKVASFVSCKGGSGATFLAANVAHGLATVARQRVLLVDLNLQFGDASLMLTDRKPPASIVDVARQSERLDAALLQSSIVEVEPGFGVLAGPEDPAVGAEVGPAHLDALLRFARPMVDWIVLDVGRSFDALSVQALDLSDHIVPVLQASLPYVRDGRRMVELLRSLGYPNDRVKPLLNRAGKGGEVSPEDLQRTIGLPLWASVPNDHPTVSASINQGVPVLKLAPRSAVARGLQSVVARMAEQPAETGSGWLSRILNRS